MTDLYASEVMVCGLEDKGQVQVLEGDGNQVLWAGTQLSDPNSNSDQVLQALASPSTPESEPHGHGEELWQEQGQGEEEGDERGRRRSTIRPGCRVPILGTRDARGRHASELTSRPDRGRAASAGPTSSRPGPGAASAESGCRTLQPSEHGLTRKAGPLSKDVETALAKEDPEKLKGTVKLKDARVGLNGAEQSLPNQLAKIKEKKANLVKQAENSEKNTWRRGRKRGWLGGNPARSQAQMCSVREKKMPVKKEPDRTRCQLRRAAKPGRQRRRRRTWNIRSARSDGK